MTPTALLALTGTGGGGSFLKFASEAERVDERYTLHYTH